MPRFDLRQDHETLKPLAPFQVLAVMCCPTNRIRREKMMGYIQATSGMALPRRRPFSSEEFRREVRLSSLNAVVLVRLAVRATRPLPAASSLVRGGLCEQLSRPGFRPSATCGASACAVTRFAL